jgi:hypothetical protein
LPPIGKKRDIPNSPAFEWYMARQARRVTLGFLSVLGIVVLVGPESGCTRRFYRKFADRQVEEILKEKDRIPNSKIEQMGFYPDPRARFGDSTNPDRPPMPPDDPTTQTMSPNPQRPYWRSGIGLVEGNGYLQVMKAWDAENRAQAPLIREKMGIPKDVPSFGDLIKTQTLPYIQAAGQLPYPRSELECKEHTCDPLNAGTPFLLTMDQMVELSVLNSREFQAERENVYLVALGVTLERFTLAAQATASGAALLSYLGREVGPGGQGQGGGQWQVGPTSLGIGKLFSTGALLLLNWANTTVINLSGNFNRPVTSVSTASLSLVQPFLRGGGKAVTLEPLTQAERNLVYEIRFFARYRKEWYQYITGGQAGFGVNTLDGDPVQPTNFGRNPLQPGAVSSGAVSTTGAPIVVGGLSLLPSAPGVPGGGPTSFPNVPAATSQGFLPTLLQAANLYTQIKNMERLTYYLKLYEAYEEGGEVSNLQVGQIKRTLLQTIAGSNGSILPLQQTLRDNLDNLKIQLGLPTNLLIELDDSLLHPITKQLILYEAIIAQYDETVDQVSQYDSAKEVKQLRPRLEKLLFSSALVQGTEVFKKTFPGRWESWRRLDAKALNDRRGELIRKRDALRKLKDDREKVGKSLSSEEKMELDRLDSEFQVGEFERKLRIYETEPWKKGNVSHSFTFRDLRNYFNLVLEEARNERMNMVMERWPELPPVVIGGVDLINDDIERAYAAATCAALENRLDLMNARAKLVDSWRQLRIWANSLMGVFNMGYQAATSTPPGLAEPFAFNAHRTTHQLTMNFQLPLVRYAERNNYRASLIAYQRARRALQAMEDQVAFQARTEIRALRVFGRTYGIQKIAMDVAYKVVDNALETFKAPPNPDIKGSSGQEAALTQQLLNAQAALPTIQFGLYTLWLNYRIFRQQIYLDTGLMQLDSRGIWIDDYESQRPAPEPATGDGTGNQPVAADLLVTTEIPPATGP